MTTKEGKTSPRQYNFAERERKKCKGRSSKLICAFGSYSLINFFFLKKSRHTHKKREKQKKGKRDKVERSIFSLFLETCRKWIVMFIYGREKRRRHKGTKKNEDKK